MTGASNNPSVEAGFTCGRARALAIECGFSEASLVALPYENEGRDAGRFADWVRAGRAGTMRYLERRAENGQLMRECVSLPFPWARSALVCFTSYQTGPSAAIRSTDPAREDAGWIARYAWSNRVDAKGVRRPSDYHKVLRRRLRVIEARLHEQFGEFESRAYVDTGPVVERALAVAAGLGWTGKNTCLIHPRLGSFGFLAVLLTSLKISEPASQRAGKSAGRQGNSAATPAVPLVPAEGALEIPDRCGTCTRCIEACPTDALIAPYQMDATRCIAYLTIEHKGPIAEELMPGMGRQVFGCDICQDVCPWNQKSLRAGPVPVDEELEARAALINPALEWLGSLDEQAFERVFNGSPVRRTGFAGVKRNVAIAMGNSGLARFAPQLEAWTTAPDEGLRVAARWALKMLGRDARA